MARSAPIARPVRSCSCAVFWPMETSVTSVPLTFSLMRRASSMAISSKGLMTHLTLSVLILVPSAPIFTMVSGSGTCLAVTRIFTRVSSRELRQGSGRRRFYTPRNGQVNRTLPTLLVLPSLSGLRFTASDVEAEAARQLAPGLQNERRDLLLDALGREAG